MVIPSLFREANRYTVNKKIVRQNSLVGVMAMAAIGDHWTKRGPTHYQSKNLHVENNGRLEWTIKSLMGSLQTVICAILPGPFIS